MSDTTNKRFKTKHYEQRYIQEIQGRSGIVSMHGRAIIIGRLHDEEEKWLANMGSEYEEVMHAQAANEEANEANEEANGSVHQG